MTAVARVLPSSGQVIGLLSASIIGASFYWSMDDGGTISGHRLLAIAVFMVAIAVGEVARVALLYQRESAPLSTAAALAFAMTSQTTAANPTHIPSSVVIVATAVAMMAGGVVRWGTGRSIDPAQMSARLTGVATVAFLYRRAQFGGQTLLEWQEQHTRDRWLVAIVMLAVCSIGMLVKLVLIGLWRSRREHVPTLRGVVNEIRGGLGLSFALVTSSALVALAERPLGIIAVPLFLFPLMLTQFAVRRNTGIRETYRQTIEALSRLTELSGHTRSHHANRVSRLSMTMGRDLGMGPRDLEDLERAALLHDLGQVALREPIPGGATVLAAPADQIRLARDGAEIVRQTGVLDRVAELLEAQTTPYRQVREYGEPLPMASRIIKVANAFDDYTAGSRTHEAVESAMERIHLGLGYEYDPAVVDSLTRVLARRSRVGAHVSDLGSYR